MFTPVYLDHNATTPLLPAVREAMLPYLDARFGNPSSRHEYGRAARDAVDRARHQVANAVGAHATEVIFTSGGTEANNLFLKGAAPRHSPGRVVVSAVEHPSVLHPARDLKQDNWTVGILPVDENGQIDAAGWQRELAHCDEHKNRPTLFSLMLANNETGVAFPVFDHVAQAKAHGALCHTDAVQALGKQAVNFRTLGVHAMTLSAHKIGGPKGAGALILDKRIDLAAEITGGGQERGLRSGTENVAAIVGFGAACEHLAERLNKHEALGRIRDHLEQGLVALGATVFGRDAPRLNNTSYFAFTGIDGETLVGQLDRAGYAIASGAACSSANPSPSHVLAAMGVAPEMARGAIRISLGPDNLESETTSFLETLNVTLKRLRKLTSVAH